MTEVTEKMVKAAYRAWARSDSATDFDRLRAAIEAALAAKEPVDAGELVAWLRNPTTRSDNGDILKPCSDAADAIEKLVDVAKLSAKELTETGGRAHALLTRMGIKL